MIHPFREQPRLRAAIPGANRPDLEVHEIGGRHPLDLEPPALSFDERGETQELPAQMPAQAVAPYFAATLIDAVVATVPDTGRSYLLTACGELVVDSVDDSPNVWRRAEGDWRRLAALGAAPRAHPGQVVLLGGQRAGYWHWWVDILPRVWLLETHGPSRAAAAPLAIPPPQLPYQRESLELLGLAPRLELLAPGLSQFAGVTFTRGLTGGGSRYPAPGLGEYARWLRERLALGATKEKRGRRLFVSRSSASSRRVVNEAELEPVLVGHGFEVVDPAGMPLADQVVAFSQASAVVGPHGGGLTDLLVSQPGTQVLEIFAAPAALGVSNYRVLASHLGLPYGRLLAEPVPNEGGGPHDYDIAVDPQLLTRALARLSAA